MPNRKVLLRPLFYALRGFLLRGDRRACPLCEGTFRRFLPKGDPARAEAMCPRCLSLERHRLLWPTLQTLLTPSRGEKKGLALLHFGPEESIRRRFRRMPLRLYLTADLTVAARPAMSAMDITRIGLKSKTFDRVLCCHVLEHVPDDAAALRELYRVLRPGGAALLQVPLRQGPTDEDPSVTDPVERSRRFGQEDHVRLYGHEDFPRRVAAAGFRVEVVSGLDGLSPAEIERKRLSSGGDGDELMVVAWRDPAP